MITTVNPRVVVNDGVCDFGPKVHLRGVKAQYTQTWWLRPPPFLSEKFVCTFMVGYIILAPSLFLMVLFYAVMFCLPL